MPWTLHDMRPHRDGGFEVRGDVALTSEARAEAVVEALEVAHRIGHDLRLFGEPSASLALVVARPSIVGVEWAHIDLTRGKD